MKIDTDYLKGFLKACQDSKKPFTNIHELRKAGFDCQDEQFIFHLQILEDQGLVQEATDRDLGYEFTAGGKLVWREKPLRLTAAGHEFIGNLEKSEIWEIIKKDFTHESIGTLIEVAKNLAIGFAKERLNKYLTKV